MQSELRKAYDEYMCNVLDFQEGELVGWKPGLRNLSHEGPFIFMEKVPRKNFLDAVVCTLLEDGTFWTLTVDSRRLQRVSGELKKEESARGMSFGEAIEAMKKGWRVSRAGWNGKGMYVYPIPEHGANPVFLPYIAMKTVDGKIVPWLASQTDMLADDWFTVSQMLMGEHV